MKRPYSLDYSIHRDVDRLKAVEEILATVPKKLTSQDLETMASYILYGKDENNQNAVQRKETTDDETRYNSFRKKDAKLESLDTLLDNPFVNQNEIHPFDERCRYIKKKTNISRTNDADIPGMRELWESIDRCEHTLAVAQGKVLPKPNEPVLTDSYRIYKLQHQIIDLRRHQYYLKDCYKPTIHFQNLQSPGPQTVNFDSDAAYYITEDELREKIKKSLLPLKEGKDFERESDGRIKWFVAHQKIDYTNPRHIKAIMDNYSDLVMQVWDKPESWGNALILDFERYVKMAHFSKVRFYMLVLRIDHASLSEIEISLQEKFGIHYGPAHISNILSHEIPNQIATTALRHQLLVTSEPENCKRCFTCRKILPKHPLFFARHAGRKDGFSSNCKECERKRRTKGGELRDRRVKTANADMPKV